MPLVSHSLYTECWLVITSPYVRLVSHLDAALPRSFCSCTLEHLLFRLAVLTRFWFCHQVKATLQYGDMVNTADMLCSISFDRDDEYFATAGVSRRIKVGVFAP